MFSAVASLAMRITCQVLIPHPHPMASSPAPRHRPSPPGTRATLLANCRTQPCCRTPRQVLLRLPVQRVVRVGHVPVRQRAGVVRRHWRPHRLRALHGPAGVPVQVRGSSVPHRSGLHGRHPDLQQPGGPPVMRILLVVASWHTQRTVPWVVRAAGTAAATAQAAAGGEVGWLVGQLLSAVRHGPPLAWEAVRAAADAMVARRGIGHGSLPWCCHVPCGSTCTYGVDCS